MRKWIALWVGSMVIVAVAASTLTAAYLQQPRTDQRTPQIAPALPWSMGVLQSVERGPNDSTVANDVFINLPVGCGVFSPSKASSWPTKCRFVGCRIRGEMWTPS